MNLRGKTVLITGANRGLGAALVDAFLEAGAATVHAASRRPIETDDPRVRPLTLDICDEGQVRAAAEACPDVDVVVNNAGVAPRGPAAHGLDDAMRTNYLGTRSMCSAFTPVLQARREAALVNVLSILALAPFPGVGSYAASKAAALSLTQSLRVELPGVLVMGVLPAFIETDMTEGIPGPKMSTAAVATAIVEGLIAGSEEVYPGPAAELVAAFHRDPLAYARSLAAGSP